MTGTPCTDYSAANNNRPGLHGKTLPVLLCWSQIIQRLGVPAWIHENVLGQPVDVLRGLFGADYDLRDFVLSPAMVGFALVERQRRYVLAIDKSKAEYVCDPAVLLNYITSNLKLISTEPRHAVLAPWEEVLHEARDLCRIRKIEWPAQLDATASSAAATVDWSFVLTPRERESLQGFTCEYVRRFGMLPFADPNAFFYLGDNASYSLTWSCVSGRLPTLRTGRGLCWCPHIHRWLTVNEHLATMGFPTYPDLARSMGVSVLQFDDLSQARRFLGNAMHAGVAGVTLVVLLSCVRLKEAPDNYDL